MAIRRLADNNWYDFVTPGWATAANYAALTTDYLQALTDEGDGSYSAAWYQATADASSTNDYEMVYHVTAGTGYVGTMAGEAWRFLPGAAGMTDYLDTTERRALMLVEAATAGEVESAKDVTNPNTEVDFTLTPSEGTPRVLNDTIDPTTGHQHRTITTP